MWVKIKHPTSPAVLVGYVYRNPAATHPWFDDFVQMMDKVCESNPNIVLVGDLNIDLLTSTYPVFCYFFVCFAPTNTLCNKNNSNFCYIAHSYIYIYIQIMNKCCRMYEFLISASVTTVQSSARGHANSPKI